MQYNKSLHTYTQLTATHKLYSENGESAMIHSVCKAIKILLLLKYSLDSDQQLYCGDQ